MSSDPEDTFVLLSRHRQGDPLALDAIMRRHYPRVERIVSVRLKAKGNPRADVADLVQQTMLKALSKIDQFERQEDARLIDWIAVIATREIIAHHRYHHAGRRDVDREVTPTPDVSNATSTAPIFETPGDQSTPSQHVASQEEQRLLDSCIAELPAEQREVILLRNYAGASWEFIAEKLGRASADAARKFHKSASDALKTKLLPHLGSGRDE